MVAAGRLVGLARAGAASQPGSDGGRTDDQEEIPPLDRHPDTLPRVWRVSHPTWPRPNRREARWAGRHSPAVAKTFSPHLTTDKDPRVGVWAKTANVEIAYTPTNSSWLNRIEAQFTALRYFTLDGTDHTSHKEQASTIRRYIIWRNNHACDERLRRIVGRASTA